MCHVKLWRRIGRQDSRLGTVRRVEGQDTTFLQAVIKQISDYRLKKDLIFHNNVL